jgi:hypothetical protein
LEHLKKRDCTEDLGVDRKIIYGLALIVLPSTVHLLHRKPASTGHSVAASVVRTTVPESKILKQFPKNMQLKIKI